MPVAKSLPPGVERDLARQSREVCLHFIGVLVGVDAEVAELAALAAKGDVQVKAQAGVLFRRGIEGIKGGGDMLGGPGGERGIIGDEVAAYFGLFGLRDLIKRDGHRRSSLRRYGTPGRIYTGQYPS